MPISFCPRPRPSHPTHRPQGSEAMIVVRVAMSTAHSNTARTEDRRQVRRASAPVRRRVSAVNRDAVSIVTVPAYVPAATKPRFVVRRGRDAVWIVANGESIAPVFPSLPSGGARRTPHSRSRRRCRRSLRRRRGCREDPSHLEGAPYSHPSESGSARSPFKSWYPPRHTRSCTHRRVRGAIGVWQPGTPARRAQKIHAHDATRHIEIAGRDPQARVVDADRRGPISATRSMLPPDARDIGTLEYRERKRVRPSSSITIAAIASAPVPDAKIRTVSEILARGRCPVCSCWESSLKFTSLGFAGNTKTAGSIPRPLSGIERPDDARIVRHERQGRTLDDGKRRDRTVTTFTVASAPGGIGASATGSTEKFATLAVVARTDAKLVATRVSP